MHEWMKDPERRGEGLVCRNCGATEAEVDLGHRFDEDFCPDHKPTPKEG